MRRGEQLGKYKIRRRIASGAYATVYEAKDVVLDMLVALKVPHYESDHDLLIEEAKHVMSLCHPNILPILNVDYADDRLVVASPLGRESLREQSARGLTVVQGLAYAEQIAAALAHAHQHGLLHLDVKPENLIVLEDRLALCDFGLAKKKDQSSSISGTSGTVGYLAPEQALGKPTMASDVFAAGLVIWEMMTGELPQWPFSEPLPGRDLLDARVVGELAAVLTKALAVQEADRYPDASALVLALSPVADQIRTR